MVTVCLVVVRAARVVLQHGGCHSPVIVALVAKKDAIKNPKKGFFNVRM